VQLRPGYQQTGVGPIPEDWRLSSLGHEAELLSGFPFLSQGFAASGIRLLRGSNVKRGQLDWSREITEHWPAVTSKIKQYELQESDIVIAMDGALVGRSFAIVKRADLPSLLVQRVARVRAKATDQRLLGAWINSDYFIRHVDSVKTHTAIPHISPRDIRDFAVAIPRAESEQRAIAEALSDVDALLDGLTRLIAKKRDLKQGAMQQLLTGRTRLPGFGGEWASVRLAEIGDAYGGLTGKSSADFGAGGARYIAFMDVIRSVSIRSGSTFERVRVGSGEAQNAVKRGDLLLNGSSETPEEVAMGAVCDVDEQDLFLNSFCFGFRLRPSAEADALFLAYLLRSDAGRTVMRSLAQGSTRYNMAKSAFLDACLLLPSRSEQGTIATVLSHMDAELAVLEARRAKTQALKQAMMQSLLTGRIRLVCPEPAHA